MVKKCAKKVKDIEDYDLKKHSVFIRNSYENPIWWRFPRVLHVDIEAENFFMFDKDAPASDKIETIKVYPSAKTELVGVESKLRRVSTGTSWISDAVFATVFYN